VVDNVARVDNSWLPLLDTFGPPRKEDGPPTTAVNVLTLNIHPEGQRYNNGLPTDYSRVNGFSATVATAIDDNPNVDIIMTPEHCLYFHPSRSLAIEFQETEGRFLVSNGQPEIVAEINNLQQLAAQKNVNIVLGTVCEKATIAGVDTYNNSAVIIDNKGSIVRIRRKSTGSESPFFFADDYPAEKHQQIKDALIETASAVSLTTQHGDTIKVIVNICAERIETDILVSNRETKADLMLTLVNIGEDSLTSRSQQQFDNIPHSRCGYEYAIEAANRLGAITPNAAVIAVDGGASPPESGIFVSSSRLTIKSIKPSPNTNLFECLV